jgi:hypothetical protein
VSAAEQKLQFSHELNVRCLEPARQERLWLPDPQTHGSPVAPIQRDVVPAFSAGDDRIDGDDQNIDPLMLDFTGTPWILNRRKVLDQFSTDIAVLPSSPKEQPVRPVKPSDPTYPFHA